MTVVPVTSADLDAAEVSWFAALCSDDYEYLGVPDGRCGQAGRIVRAS
jgi:alkanesulfonate monooxygenase